MKCLIYYTYELRQAIKDRLLEMGFDDLCRQQEILEAEETKLFNTLGGASQIDRLGEVSFGINSRSLDLIPPNKEWNNPPELSTLLEHAAQKLCKKDKKIDVLWSGGIDSTTTLLLLKEYAEKDQLSVIMSEGSIVEYPWLYESLVKHLPHVINRELNYRSEMKPDRITAHGNEADHYYRHSLQQQLLVENQAKATEDRFDWETSTGMAFYTKLRFMWPWTRYRNLESVLWDKVEIENSSVPSCESLYIDYDVQRFFISKYLKNEMYVPAQTIIDGYFNTDILAWNILMKSSSKNKHLLPLSGKWRDSEIQNINVGSQDIKDKMELRDIIFKLTNDREYAYKKPSISSFWHGQLDAGGSRNQRARPPNVGICDDGEIIRWDQLKDIDPFDFIIP